MNLPKAIELGEDIERSGEYEGDPDDSDALKLLCEAGLRILKERERMNDPAWGHLPGETL